VLTFTCANVHEYSEGNRTEQSIYKMFLEALCPYSSYGK
jgi:hypothetical protein